METKKRDIIKYLIDNLPHDTSNLVLCIELLNGQIIIYYTDDHGVRYDIIEGIENESLLYDAINFMVLELKKKRLYPDNYPLNIPPRLDPGKPCYLVNSEKEYLAFTLDYFTPDIDMAAEINAKRHEKIKQLLEEKLNTKLTIIQ
jgi:hypothetical protein